MEKRDYLAICATIKDEGPYLRDWIEFHKIVGVGRFYLYDNGSRDNTREVLGPYLKKGEVVLVDWPIHPGQVQAYNHCLKHFSAAAHWIAFIDLDEFLFGTEQDSLCHVLRDYEAFCGVVVNWLIFGSSGHARNPGGLVIKNFTRRAPLEFMINSHIKTILHTSSALGCANAHAFFYQGEACPVDEDKNFISPTRKNLFGAVVSPKAAKLRINHYIVKSLQESERKRLRGRATVKALRPKQFFKNLDRNDEVDVTIQRFVPLLTKRLSL